MIYMIRSQKMKSGILFSLGIIVWIIAACQERSDHPQKVSAERDPLPADNTSAVQEQIIRPERPETLRAIARERANDSIISKATAAFIKDSDWKSIQPLDSLAQISDGSLSTDVSIATTELFEENFKGFIEFLYAHPNSDLAKHFVYGMSEEFVVYDWEERELKIKELKARAKVKCKEEGLDQAKIKFTESLLNKIDPSMFG